MIVEKNIRNNISELKEFIIDSIKLRYRSDVEVGSCLSGGIDYSSIVSVSSKILRKKIKTFSAIYRINECNEEKYVDEMENQFDINSHKVFPKHAGLLDNIEKMIYYQDEPILAYGVYSQWSIMECAKSNKIKVFLDGQGADELFAGYFSYTTYFLPALLHYEDRNSMLFSIEARVPFLDHRIFEKAISIPFYQKVNGGRPKYVLREAMKDILPQKIYKRRSKLGYPTPFAYWIRKY